MNNQIIINDIVNNFKEITGYKIKELLYKKDDKVIFNDDMVDYTIDNIKDYVKNKYGINLLDEDDILIELDNKLIEEFV